MADDPTQHERRRATREPDDPLTARFDAAERRVMDATRAHIKDVEDRLERRIRSTEEHATQVETTAVNGHSLLLARVAGVQTAVDKLGSEQADFRAWMQAEKSKDQQIAADLHDQAIRDQARADLILTQQQAKGRRARQRNRVLAIGMTTSGGTAVIIGGWLFTQAAHETQSAVAFAISGLVACALILVALALQWDPADGA